MQDFLKIFEGAFREETRGVLPRLVRGAGMQAGLAAIALSLAATPGFAQTSDNDYNGYNYAGVGLSDEGWVVHSKARLTPNLSARPAALVDFDFDDVKLLVPVTYDFPAVNAGGAELLPFGGAGVSFGTGGDDHFNALVTGGVDYRFSEKWTATGSANLSFAGDTDLDVTVGVGYSF